MPSRAEALHHDRWSPLLLVALLAATACGDDSVPRSSAGPGPGAQAGCVTMLNALGRTHLMFGASMRDSTAASAPFDLRYMYITGGIADGDGPCNSCASDCSAGGRSCASSGGGCMWWGCWQWDQEPPGRYVVDFVERSARNQVAGAPRPLVPMLTYYQWLNTCGASEGTPEVEALANAELLRRYFGDYRFMLQSLGATRALVHLEPDLWGYANRVSADPHAIPVSVRAANARDCDDQEDNVAGFGRCLVAMARKYAPEALVGMHASSWSTGFDALHNTSQSLDVAAEARKLAAFLVEVGAGRGDFIGADMSDRDAAYHASRGQHGFWDATNATLPSFTQAFTWSSALAEAVGLPLVWWQTPVGNMALADGALHWRDNRLDYVFDHPEEVTAAHGVAVLFGPGDGQQTTPESDGGNLVARVQAYAASGGVLACGPEL